MESQNWFYQQNNQQFGPVGRDQIAHLLSQGLLTPFSYVWTEGMDQWQPVGQLPEFAAVAAVAAGEPSPPQRPTAVTVLGTLNIIFGGLSLLCSPLGIIGLLVPQPQSPFQLSAGMKMTAFVSYCVGLIFAVILLASGVGLLKLKSWARQMAYIYGWVALIWGILGIIVNAILFIPALNNIPQEAAPGIIGGLIGGFCGGLLGLIYPVFLIVYLRKPHIVSACSQ